MKENDNNSLAETLVNYEMLIEMIPELGEVVYTGMVTLDAAKAVFQELSEVNQIDFVESLDCVKRMLQQRDSRIKEMENDIAAKTVVETPADYIPLQKAKSHKSHKRSFRITNQTCIIQYSIIRCTESSSAAISGGNADEIAEAKQYYDDINKSVQVLMNTDASKYSSQFKEIGDQLNTAAIKANEFNQALSGEGENGFQKHLQSVAEEIKNLDMDDADFKAAVASGDVDSINYLVQTAEQAGII